MGIRLALGSSRARIIGQVLAESAVLAALGGIAAIVLARIAGGALSTILLPDVVWRVTGLEWRIAGLVLLLSCLAGIAAGIVPAIEASRPGLSEALRSGGRGHSGSGRRARAVLTIVQTALSLVLLVGSGLFVRSVQQARAVDLGFDAAGVLLFTPEYERGLSGAQMGDIMRRTRLRLLDLPGVESVSGDVTVPFMSFRGTSLRVPGVDSIPGGAAIHVVDPGYFSTVGLRIVRGRAIDEDDSRAGERVALVNETMARTLWPGEDALGKCLIVGDGPANGPEPGCSTVVGVAEDSHSFSLVEEPSMHYFVPAAQEVVNMYPDALLIRVSPEIGAMIAPVRQAILQAEPALRYAQVTPLQALVDPSARSWRLGASMFTAFGLLALLVAGIGLYSVLAFAVAERTQELGIRAALGAGRGRLIGVVVVHAMTMVASGVGLGLMVALIVAERIEPLLFEVGGRDPLVLAVAALSLIVVGALASWIPALRATRVDPGNALRAD